MIKDLKENDTIREIFLLDKREIAVSSKGKKYGKATLSDASGKLDAFMWDNFQQLETLKQGSIVEAQGVVTSFNSALQLRLVAIAECTDPNVNLTQLLPASEYDIDDMLGQVIDIAKTIQNPWLSKLVHHFYSDPAILKKMKSHPGAAGVHHAFLGGLLQHTLTVAKLSDSAAKMYPFANRDLVVAVALLHDIGKLQELQSLPVHGFTVTGALFTHPIIGQNMVLSACNAIDGFPSELRDVICHCILAHHGELEWGAAVKPVIVEAYIVHCCDTLDAHAQVFREALTGGNSTLDDIGFTSKNFVLGTKVTELTRLYSVDE